MSWSIGWLSFQPTVAQVGVSLSAASLLIASISWGWSKSARKQHLYKTAFIETHEYLASHQQALRRTGGSIWPDTIVMDPPNRLLVCPGWILNLPQPIDAVKLNLELAFTDHSDAPKSGIRYQARIFPTLGRYSASLVNDAGQGNLFDGTIYRPLNISIDDQGNIEILAGRGKYFDYLDTSEAICFARAGRIRTGKSPRINMSAVRDPFDLRNRVASLGVNTLTIRASPIRTSFLLHGRNMNLENESSSIHVIPAGEFSPSDISPASFKTDFDLWRNIMREYAEELLGVPEAQGRGGRSIDYSLDSPYADLEAAKASGQLHAYVLGIGLDPLCLKPELLTVVIISESIFATIFRNLVAENVEGTVISGSEGIEWTEENVNLCVSNPDTTLSARACISLAWKNRAALRLAIF